MPYCRACGNRRLFAASRVPPAAPTANGFASGLLGDFNDGGELVTITRLGADKSMARAAGGHPAEYFDTCLVCGSQDVDWSG
jgi:hypothetical protein